MVMKPAQNLLSLLVSQREVRVNHEQAYLSFLWYVLV